MSRTVDRAFRTVYVYGTPAKGNMPKMPAEF